METSASYVCAYCGESVDIDVDPSAAGTQQYVEDCWVCCRPNVLTVIFDRDGDVSVTARPES